MCVATTGVQILYEAKGRKTFSTSSNTWPPVIGVPCRDDKEASARMPSMIRPRENSGEEVPIDIHPNKRSRKESVRCPKPLAQPLGNLLLQATPFNCREPGLGKLAVLSDELIASIFSELNAPDYIRCQGTSKAFYAFSRIEGHWKLEYIKKSRGALENWSGSWRSTYTRNYVMHRDYARVESGCPTDDISIGALYSDVLYLPFLAANYDANILEKSSSFMRNIRVRDGCSLTAADLQETPMILQNLMSEWPALRTWTLDTIARQYPQTKFRAEAVLTLMEDYEAYHDACKADESPLYIFDADFVEKTRGTKGAEIVGLERDFQVPEVFQDDLFKVLAEERPNYRWLIAGPERSGSTFHCDPNGTSAWNAVVTGRKLWILFPPDIVPPGIMVSEDQSEVEAPLSLAEWLLNYYPQAKAMYGPRAKDPKLRGKMLEGVCETGEIFYVPAGWWHLVVNLESSIAVTQNFVSPSNLAGVLYFLKHRSDQVSGFKLKKSDEPSIAKSNTAVEDYRGEEEDETGGGVVFARFVDALQKAYPEVAKSGLSDLAKLEEKATENDAVHRRSTAESSLWNTVTGVDQQDQITAIAAGEISAGFTFGFDVGEFDSEEVH